MQNVLKNPSDSNRQQASLPTSPNRHDLRFERPEWKLFRSVNTLPQKAGVEARHLRRLVLKELTDNALDAPDVATVTVGETPDGGYYVEDDGAGIAGTDADIARLFSVNRPLVSSKLWRMPTRGAMGNGLRVVVGAVAASDGELVVYTRNRRIVLRPQEDGSTAADSTTIDRPVGTRIEIRFGAPLPFDANALFWAREAIAMNRGETYRGKPSPWWYDADQFFEMLQAASGDRPVRELIANLDGCSGAKAGQIAGSFKGRSCRSLNSAEATALLKAARLGAKRVQPKRLGEVGSGLRDAYAAETGTVHVGRRPPVAEIPFVAEVWCSVRKEGRSIVRAFVNRTPIAGDVYVSREKKELGINGCGLDRWLDVGSKANFDILFNLTAPHVPITTDGKAPNLSCFSEGIYSAIQKAARKAKRVSSVPTASAEKLTQKDVILKRLAEGVAKASDGGSYRFTQRQLFYVVRPFVITEAGGDLTYANFEKVITDHESVHGGIAGMSRDPRGTLYHPHLREDIPLGTRAVDNYKRPEWTFNKVLYIEKEGFFEILKSAKWPERHDCALLTSKGFASRAARDLIDLLAKDDETVTVFCVHDADAAGTMIYQALQGETRARARRSVEIVNFGLEPWEALDMGLQVEPLEGSKRRSPVADYVKKHGGQWGDWLQENRVELNAMTTPQFLTWLDSKMAQHVGKVIPPEDVMLDHLRTRAREQLQADITAKILAEARLDDQVRAAFDRLTFPSAYDLRQRVTMDLQRQPSARWSVPVERAANDVVRRSGSPA